MNGIIKAIALTAAICSFSACLFGCEKKEESSNVVITEDEMPYGATITQLKASEDNGIKIGIDYDNRFISEDEARLVSNYVAALNSKDAELMEQVYYPPYFESIVNASGEADGTAYLQSRFAAIEERTGGTTDMEYVTIESVEDDKEMAEEYSNLEIGLKEIAGEDITSKIRSKKVVGIDIIYSLNGENSISLANTLGQYSYLFIYDIDGQLYIL